MAVGERAEGEGQLAASFPAVRIDFEQPLADAQMTVADSAACALTYSWRDDASFFFLRGSAAVNAFDCGLHEVTH